MFAKLELETLYERREAEGGGQQLVLRSLQGIIYSGEAIGMQIIFSAPRRCSYDNISPRKRKEAEASLPRAFGACV